MASSLERPVAEAVDVVLRDGGTLRLRPPLAADGQALLAFFEGLSDESRFLRFHGFRRIESGLVEPLLDPDWSERGTLAGWLADRDREERVVAVGSYTRISGSTRAEMAFAVDDSEQGRGIGTRLLEQLAGRARDAGIDRFVAEVMASNAAALSVFTDAGFELMRARESGEVELGFPLAATGTLASRVEERDHTAVVASLRPFFAAATVAVIGASRRRGSIGGELFRNILEADFVGAAFPVNLKGEPVAGVRAYASVGEIEDTVDLAVICLPAEHVLDAASDALRHGVPCPLRDLRRLRRDRRGRSRAAGPSARARARARRSARRPQLPRHRRPGPRTERDLRPARAPGRPDRLLVPERRARSGAAREGYGARTRVLLLRLDRQQGRRLLERPARVVGGRRGNRPRPPLPRVVRQPADVRASCAPGRPPQADPRAEGRFDLGRLARRELAHRGAGQLRRRSRRALPPGRRPARTNARGARRRRRPALDPAAPPRPPRRGDHERRRARHPLRRRLRERGARASGADRADPAGARDHRSRRSEPRATRSTSSARRPRRPTRQWFRTSSPTRTSMR